MEAQEVIDDFKKEISLAKEQGHSSLTTESLLKYLDLIEQDADSSIEHNRQVNEGELAKYAAESQMQITMFNAVVESGKTALQSLLVINGGAVIALMGVMSNLVGKTDGKSLAVSLACPLLLFGFGVLAAASGFSFRYISQAFYANEGTDPKWYSGGNVFRWGAILSAITGFVLFGFGLYSSYLGFSSAFQ